MSINDLYEGVKSRKSSGFSEGEKSRNCSGMDGGDKSRNCSGNSISQVGTILQSIYTKNYSPICIQFFKVQFCFINNQVLPFILLNILSIQPVSNLYYTTNDQVSPIMSPMDLNMLIQNKKLTFIFLGFSQFWISSL